MRIRSMQCKGRNASIAIYVDASIASTRHRELGVEVPKEMGLLPWEVVEFEHPLHLQQLVSTDLIVQCAERWRDNDAELS